MARSTTCILDGRNISIEKAIRWWDVATATKSQRPDFRCIECNEEVRPHKEGGNSPAHFEHFHSNEDCSLSGPPRPRR